MSNKVKAMLRELAPAARGYSLHLFFTCLCIQVKKLLL